MHFYLQREIPAIYHVLTFQFFSNRVSKFWIWIRQKFWIYESTVCRDSYGLISWTSILWCFISWLCRLRRITTTRQTTYNRKNICTFLYFNFVNGINNFNLHADKTLVWLLFLSNLVSWMVNLGIFIILNGRNYFSLVNWCISCLLMNKYITSKHSFDIWNC